MLALLMAHHAWPLGLDLLHPGGPRPDPGWPESLGWLALGAIALGVMAFTFAIVCVVVASALSIALTIVIVVVNALRRSLAWRRSTPVTQE